MLTILVLASAFSAVLARLVPRLDAALAWSLGLLLMALAGTRTGGFDYDEYLMLIEVTRSLEDADFGIRLAAAKDPLFLFFIDFAGWFTEDEQLVFLLVAFVSVSCKVLASSALPRRRTQFMALYAVLLAPGLEFAAIRAAMGLGFVLLAFSMAWRYRQLWMVFGIASHMSMAMVAVSKLLHTHRWKVLAVGAAVVLPALPTVLAEVSEDARFGQYFNNRGTLGALVFPMFTAVGWLAARQAALALPRRHPLLRDDAIACTSFCILVAFVLALPSVTTSFRILELSWALLLAQLVALGTVRVRRNDGLLVALAWALMLAILCLSNILRDTWAQMLPLTF